MNPERKSLNPPIAEAVCEFRIVPGTPWDLAVPGLVYERLRSAFPKRRQVKTVQAAIVGGAVSTQESEQLQLLQEDEKTIVAIAKDAFMVSRLKPYQGWEAFRPVILGAFEAYREVTSPSAFQTLGLRYVNLIKVLGIPVERK